MCLVLQRCLARVQLRGCAACGPEETTAKGCQQPNFRFPSSAQDIQVFHRVPSHKHRSLLWCNVATSFAGMCCKHMDAAHYTIANRKILHVFVHRAPTSCRTQCMGRDPHGAWRCRGCWGCTPTCSEYLGHGGRQSQRRPHDECLHMMKIRVLQGRVYVMVI